MITTAGIAQLGERQTEDLKVACSIHAHRIFISFSILQIVNTFPKTHYYHQIKKFIRQSNINTSINEIYLADYIYLSNDI